MKKWNDDLIAVILGLIILLIAVGGGLAKESAINKTASLLSPVASIFKPTGSSDTSPAASSTTQADALTAQEIAKHNSASDCWFIVDNGVYNVTGYINLHPGGPGRIISYCGQDATNAFKTKGGRGSHSTMAYNLLTKLKIGYLGQVATQQTIDQAGQAPATQPVFQTGEREFEDD